MLKQLLQHIESLTLRIESLEKKIEERTAIPKLTSDGKFKQGE